MITVLSSKGPEHYFISQWKPRPLLLLNLFVSRLVLWGPWPFLGLSVGLPANGDKQRVLQAYIGVKCDPSKTRDGWRAGGSGWWMRLDWYECLAVRVHWADTCPVWDNQGEP